MGEHLPSMLQALGSIPNTTDLSISVVPPLEYSGCLPCQICLKAPMATIVTVFSSACAIISEPLEIFVNGLLLCFAQSGTTVPQNVSLNWSIICTLIEFYLLMMPHEEITQRSETLSCQFC